LFLLVVLFVVAVAYNLPAFGRWLVYPSEVRTADVIAVNGGGEERTRYGVELYQEGIAPKIWHTDNERDRNRIMRSLIAQGVWMHDAQFIPSESTWDDATGIAALARQNHVKSILLVTSWFHGRRAVCALKHQLSGSDIAVYYAVPPYPDTLPDQWWRSSESRKQVLSELIKFAYYWPRYGMSPWSCGN
jgi:uncharacterized SAM-binding protein YcdF (DUF218 family)